jgi:hypothetical protein
LSRLGDTLLLDGVVHPVRGFREINCSTDYSFIAVRHYCFDGLDPQFHRTESDRPRYSSEAPLNTGDTKDIGDDAERVLSKDLQLPNNNDSDQGQCFCNSTTNYTPRTNECRVCVAHTDLTANFRRPDFVSVNYIAESKNWHRKKLVYSDTDLQTQIRDSVAVSRLLHIPFWLYVPVSVSVDTQLTDIVKSTGGDVVYYFTVSNYVDPIDTAAQKGLIASSSILGLSMISMLASRRFKNRPVVVSSPIPKPPRSPKPSGDPVSKAMRKTDTAEDFMQRSKEKRRQDIEKEDSRDDLL